MYTYVYDGFVTDKKHEKLLSRVETRLTDLGISGRIERLTMFKDIGEIVADAAAQGCETIVAVGDDGTVGRLIDAVVDAQQARDGMRTVADPVRHPLPRSARVFVVEREVLRGLGSPDVERILRRMVLGLPVHIDRHVVDVGGIFRVAAPRIAHVVEEI